MQDNGFLPIENYVPHRGAMLLLDRLLEASDEGAVAQVTVPRDGLFLQDAGMPVWVGMEYMAQTVAAWAGWRALSVGNQVKLGFLLGTRSFQSTVDFFAPDDLLEVRVHCELMGDNGLGMFDCSVARAGDPPLATARVSVFEPEDGSAYVAALKNQENDNHHE